MCIWQEFQCRPCNDLPKECFFRHNEVKDITADLLTETCYDIAVEPVLRPLDEKFSSGKQQSLVMRHGLIYQQEVSGSMHSVHFST